ncbi:YdcF family protein [Aureimonas leprariae]|uniref:YdcF family protein n=1 Tax=Plantimonas leprariae TaxID=2615207 RepID=A0A7V7PL38_9HYPH|nr:YdcF family protein [Aureimonas leprariae]KAB0676669.1 YdcF family protein [Aureimonas leprariae]
MFFVLSKLLWFVVQPLVALALAVLLGAILAAFGFRTVAALLYGLSALVYVVAMFSPAGLLLVGVLEDRFPRPSLPADVTGIVVLGGSFDTRVAKTRGDAELSEAGDRVMAGMALARRFPNAKVVFTGGVAAVFEDDVSEAEVAQRAFAALGLEPSRLVLEGRARNTAENAAFTKELVQPKPGETWLLVTSAFHMPRSVGCFRKVGFEVVPYPVDYRTPTGSARWRPAWADVTRNADKLQLALREYVGLVGYRLSGKIDELFPAPAAGTARR